MEQHITLPTELTLAQVLNANQIITLNPTQSWQQSVEVQGQGISVQTYKFDDQKTIKNFLKGIICSTIKQNPSHYTQQFIRSFLLIKINSLARPQCSISPLFLKSLVKFYNSKIPLKIGQAALQSDIIAQILLEINCTKYLSLDNIKNILEGDCLVVTTCCYAINDTQSYLKKMEIVFSLSFINMKGRKKAFIPIVHKEKNHKGQAQYAQRISNLVELKSGEVQMKGKVQDPYSMRCSPHVHGVAYDILEQLKEFIYGAINKFHFQLLLVDGQFYPNLQLHSQSLTLKLDFLMLCLVQIGSMSFLRSQRMLNSYLANKISNEHPNYYELHNILQRVSQMVGDNKLLSIGTNNDSTTYNNYQKDIYYSQGKFYKKCRAILYNLYHIMFLQTKIDMLCYDEKMKEDVCQELKTQIEKMQKLNIRQECGVQKFRKQWIVSN